MRVSNKEKRVSDILVRLGQLKREEDSLRDELFELRYGVPRAAPVSQKAR